jgi:hypothetical protein
VSIVYSWVLMSLDWDTPLRQSAKSAVDMIGRVVGRWVVAV